MKTTPKPPQDCANSSEPDLFQKGTWINEVLSPLNKKTLMDSVNAISSPESEAGPSLLSLQDGQKSGKSGPARARVNLSVARANNEEQQTPGTSGPCGSNLSASSDLSLLLGSRLQALLQEIGSMEYSQTWRLKTTRAGRSYWEHTAQEPRTEDNEFFGWPTAQACDGPNMGKNRGNGKERARHTPQSIKALCGWVTPSARDWKDSPGMSKTGVNPDGSIRNRNDLLPRQAFGIIPSQSNASMEKAAGLNPAFVLWLMGYPPEWFEVLRTALETPSSRKSRPCSSKP